MLTRYETLIKILTIFSENIERAYKLKEYFMNKKLWITVFILALATTVFASDEERNFRVSLTRDGEGVIIRDYIGNATELTIPSKLAGIPVHEIGNGAFAGNSIITSITIPEGVKRIGNYGSKERRPYQGVFANCINLKSVTLPEGLTVISAQAFSGCESLPEITIPSSVRVIGHLAFRNCLSLTSIDLPESIVKIGFGAFVGCGKLEKVNIPESVTRIRFSLTPIQPFRGCSRLSASSQAALLKVGYRDSAWEYY